MTFWFTKSLKCEVGENIPHLLLQIAPWNSHLVSYLRWITFCWMRGSGSRFHKSLTWTAPKEKGVFNPVSLPWFPKMGSVFQCSVLKVTFIGFYFIIMGVVILIIENAKTHKKKINTITNPTKKLFWLLPSFFLNKQRPYFVFCFVFYCIFSKLNSIYMCLYI